MASHFSTLGFYVDYARPIWSGDDTVLGTLIDQAESWEHVISADGGYDSATLKLSGTDIDINDWFEYGLGRDMKIYGHAQQRFGEYCVNEVEITIGGLTIKRGPLLGVCNRAAVTYTPITNLCDGTTGTETITTFEQNTASQALYAIQEEIVSGGTLIDDTTTTPTCTPVVLTNQAEEIRDLYLSEKAYPMTGQDLSFGKTEYPKVTLNLKGYSHFLDRYLYYQATGGSVYVSTKIKAVITADVNGILNTDYSLIADNLVLTEAQDIAYRSAKSVIDECLSFGNASDNRMILGVYNDRKVKYNAVTDQDSISYYYRTLEGRPFIETEDRRSINPWNVLPGRWVCFPDLLVGRSRSDTNRRIDPRYMLIESLTYNSVYGLSLSGGQTFRFDQLMAKRGV